MLNRNSSSSEYNGSDSGAINTLYINGQDYLLPFTCFYSDEFNEQYENVCTLGIDSDSLQLAKIHQAGNSIVFLNYLATFLILFLILVQLLIDIKHSKTKHSKFLVSFRMFFLLVTFLIILSNVIFSVGFKRYITNHTSQFDPTIIDESAYSSNVAAMVFSIITSCLISFSFYLLYKRFKRTIFYGNEKTGYSLLYV
ncbi:hypothetical protein DICPUDRAFT_79951 [Dictyostelium purpureum]|uniref:Uncharacterized protein n=1 Tax=Dictyostelium purpureum TaxID=5786 RepID=F0ZP42_DICPU|nr:uncharacterized protein DICPUDRAFT_79951 [Dictyostelium purpureum]EGC34306.1 hypothetical protein DICPUDRAFT_79951 [Dictyostelium purpureum]|eukprot:XP_003289188.1 hypothetical protein DICPUDRAFT_79951 [Dictyostelium purpureum]